MSKDKKSVGMLKVKVKASGAQAKKVVKALGRG